MWCRGDSPAEQAVSGTYEQGGPGFYGGAAIGGGFGTISTDMGPVSVNFPVPILTLPGMIIGGLAGKAKEELQDFRDALTDDLVKASSKPLSNEKIALDVYSDIRKLPGIDPHLFAPTTPIPEDADVVVYVSIKEIGIDVKKNEAIITTKAKATVTRVADETDIFSKEIQYQDRDTLSKWTDNDNAIWHDYTNFARHYIGRQFSADVFHTVALNHTLLPAGSDTVKLVRNNNWQGSSKSLTPTLAWELNLLGDDVYGPWVDEINASNTSFEVEIYDSHRPVYSNKNIPGSSHTVALELEKCHSYKWSVRPVYHVGGGVKYGEWMRSGQNGENGSVGTKASVAPAYIYDFASLDIDCRAR